MLERSHYQLLLELGRTGTVSGAADRLFISQSAASQRLQQAERRFGFPLTVRVGRRIALTPAARRLVEAAETSERALTAGEVDAQWLSTAGEPALVMALDVFDYTPWLTAAILDLAGDALVAGIEVVRAPGGEAQRFVAEQRADVALHAGVVSGALATQPLFGDPLVAVVGAHHPLQGRRVLTPDDFADIDYVTYSTTPQAGFERDSFLGPANVTPTRILRLESVTAITDVIAATNWCSILPRWMVNQHAAVSVIELDPSPPPIEWSLVQRDLGGEPHRSAAADRLVELLGRDAQR